MVPAGGLDVRREAGDAEQFIEGAPAEGGDRGVEQRGEAGVGAVGAGLLVVAGHGVGSAALVEGEHDEGRAVLVGGGVEDQRHPGLQPVIRADQAAGRGAGVVDTSAGGVVPVVAQVGGDERELGRRLGVRQVLGEMPGIGDAAARLRGRGAEGHHVLVANRGIVDDRVEVDERVVPIRVLVSNGRLDLAAGGVRPLRVVGDVPAMPFTWAGWAQSVPPIGSATPPSRAWSLPMSSA